MVQVSQSVEFPVVINRSLLSGEAALEKIPLMLADMGVSEPVLMNAVSIFAAQMIHENPGMKISDLQDGCSFYAAGYSDCFKLIKPS
jgi:hypothetical protein